MWIQIHLPNQQSFKSMNQKTNADLCATIALGILYDLLLRQKAIFIRIIQGKRVLQKNHWISSSNTVANWSSLVTSVFGPVSFVLAPMQPPAEQVSPCLPSQHWPHSQCPSFAYLDFLTVWQLTAKCSRYISTWLTLPLSLSLSAKHALVRL